MNKQTDWSKKTSPGFINCDDTPLANDYADISAKRSPAPSRKAVALNGICYSTDNTVDTAGFISAQEIKTGKSIWQKQVYKIWKNPFIESDVQDVYITEMKIENGKIIITNEKGKVFRLDLKTGE